MYQKNVGRKKWLKMRVYFRPENTGQITVLKMCEYFAPENTGPKKGAKNVSILIWKILPEKVVKNA